MIRIIFLILFVLSTTVSAQEETTRSPRFIVHLLDYLAKDYAGAVGTDGKTLSQSEYAEQIEFAENAVKTAQILPELRSNGDLQRKLSALLLQIRSKASPKVVAPLARELQQRVIELTKIDLQPLHWPSLESGKKLYAQNCAVCHGNSGLGDGVGGQGLDPAPANFVSKEGMQALSPFAAFNTIRMGVPGTGMASFSHFSDQEVWELAFYVNSLRFQSGEKARIPAEWSPLNKEVLKKVASLSDPSLVSLLRGTENEKNELLSALRTFDGKKNQGGFLVLAGTLLDDSERHFRKREFEVSQTKALQAYLEGIEPIEPKLRATDPQSVVEIEEAMSAVRSAIENRKNDEVVASAVIKAKQKINDIRLLIEDREMSPWMAFFASFAIILREGFEAVLIILALLGVTRATGSKQASAYVHGGWISSIALGVVTWAFSGWLMNLSGANREVMEGVISVFAVFVLLYVGFWLHRQTEIGRWKTFLQVKVKSFLTQGKLLGLALISFTAAFREAFETVIFLRAIWLDLGETARTSLFLGVLSALVLVITLSWVALTYSKKLPLKTLFSFSSLMMLVLATVLAGKGVHSLQEAGLFGVNALPIRMRFELLGLYPTMQTVLAQLLIAALVIVLWNYGRKPAVQSRAALAEE